MVAIRNVIREIKTEVMMFVSPAINKLHSSMNVEMRRKLIIKF